MPKRIARSKRDKTIPRNRKDANQDKRIMRVEKSLKSMKNEEELKYKDTALTSPTTTTANMDVINLLAVGQSQVTRIGGQVHMTSVQWKFTATAASGVLLPITFRYMLVLDRQPNGALATFAGSPLAGTIAILNNAVITQQSVAPIQYENIKRFRILKDKTISWNPQMSLQDANPATAVVPFEKTISGYRKLGINTKYGDDTGTITDINTNALYLITYCDSVNALITLGGTRIYYRDA